MKRPAPQHTREARRPNRGRRVGIATMPGRARERQPVRFDATSPRWHLPLALDQSVLLEAVECRKQRAGFDLERSSGRLENALGDGGAMERLEFERPQDEQIQSAFEEGRDRIRHG